MRRPATTVHGWVAKLSAWSTTPKRAPARGLAGAVRLTVRAETAYSPPFSAWVGLAVTSCRRQARADQGPEPRALQGIERLQGVGHLLGVGLIAAGQGAQQAQGAGDHVVNVEAHGMP